MQVILGITLLIAVVYYFIMITVFEQNCKALVKQRTSDERKSHPS